MTNSRDDELGEMLVNAAAGLPDARIEELKRRVNTDFDDVEARVELLGHFVSLRQPENFAPHLRYLLMHRPGIEHLDFPLFRLQLNPDLLEEFRALWMTAAEKTSDLKIALHALAAIGQDSFVDGQRLIDLGLRGAPEDEDWLCASARFYLWHGRQSRSIEMLKQASDLYQKALAQEEPTQRFALWPSAVQCALEAHQDALAAALAGDMLSADDWLSVKMKHLKHYAHSALGEVALRRGDLDEAERCLAASAKDTVNFHIDIVGPRLELARQLVEHGRREAVIAFLEEMLKQWPKGSDKLTPWLEELLAGK